MRIETYFISDKKEIDKDDIPILLWDVLYQTIVPVTGVWLFFETRIIYFLVMLLFPVFFRLKLRSKRYYLEDIRYSKCPNRHSLNK